MTITARIDAITQIRPEYRGVLLPAPPSAKIELTANCNLSCQFCVKSLRPDKSMMDRSFYSRVIREMRDAGVEELGCFFIGESFTCRWLPEAIAEAKSIGYPYVFLTTNGVAATPARVKECMEAGLDSLKFSLNFADADQMAEVAQVRPDNWQRQKLNLKAARHIRDTGGYRCGLYASSILFDGEQGEKMQLLIDEIRPFVDEHYFLPLYNMGGAGSAVGKPKAGNPGRIGALRESLPCWSVAKEAHITVTGKLSACCFGVGIDDDLVMADLNEVSFMNGWNSEKFQALRAAHLAQDVSATACAQCAAGAG